MTVCNKIAPFPHLRVPSGRGGTRTGLSWSSNKKAHYCPGDNHVLRRIFRRKFLSFVRPCSSSCYGFSTDMVAQAPVAVPTEFALHTMRITIGRKQWCHAYSIMTSVPQTMMKKEPRRGSRMAVSKFSLWGVSRFAKLKTVKLLGSVWQPATCLCPCPTQFNFLLIQPLAH